MANKWRALELLVAAIQDTIKERVDTIVESDVQLMDANGIERQIDVLVKTKVQGMPFQIAFECKDYKKAVDVQVIDALIGKCRDLPNINKKVVVSSKGFTKNARLKAKKNGVELKTLEDVSLDELLWEGYVVHHYPHYSLRSDIYLKLKSVSVEQRMSISLSKFQGTEGSKNELLSTIKNIFHDNLSTLEEIGLYEEYTRNGNTPLLKQCIYNHPYSLYLKDVYDNEYIIEEMSFCVEIVFRKRDVLLNKQRCIEKEKLYIGEFNIENENNQIVVIENDEKIGCYEKNNDKIFKLYKIGKSNYFVKDN